MPMFNPPHPGEVLREFMGDISVSAFAKHIGVTRANLSKILNGHAGISAMMSLKLDEAFGKSEGLWTRLQNSYDLAQARKVKRAKVKPITVLLVKKKPGPRSKEISGRALKKAA